MGEHRNDFRDDPVVGERVRVVSSGPGYLTESVGVYQGVVRSEWDGKPIHFFTDGDIGGVAQRCFGFPAPGCDLTTDRTPSEIVEAVA